MEASQMPKTVLFGMITLFVLIVIFMISQVISGHLYPLIDGMDPHSENGIGSVQYEAIQGKILFGNEMFFYILIGGTVFVLIIFKLFYEKEETSVQMGG